jgi:ankyrin repeat protein
MGEHLLHFACILGHERAVKALLEYGSDTNIMCIDGYTAFDRFNQRRKVRIFLEIKTAIHIIYHIMKMEVMEF